MSSIIVVTLDGNIGRFDTQSGIFEEISNTSFSLTDVAVDTNGNIFAITFGQLYSVDELSGQLSLIGNLNPPDFNGLEFVSNNRLLGSVNNSRLYEIDVATGTTSLIADLGSRFDSSGDLAFDAINNRIYATSDGAGTTSDILFSFDINSTTQAVTNVREIGAIGFRNVSALAFDNGILRGYTSDGQEILIDILTGLGTFNQNVTGLTGSIQGASSVITPANQLPVANNDSATTGVNTSVTVNVLANDTDPNGNPLSISSFDTTTNNGGRITLSDNGTPNNTTDDRLIYNPATGFIGNDTFGYNISNGIAVATGSVTVNVNANQALTGLSLTGNQVLNIDRATTAASLILTIVGQNTDKVNEIGLFRVDENNRINGIAPEDPSFVQEALQNGQIIFSSLSNRSNDLIASINSIRQLGFTPGDRLVLYLIENSTNDNLIVGGNTANVYFSLTQANSDGFNHVQISEQNNRFTFAFEDALGGGDRDFNDSIINVELSSAFLGIPQIIANYQDEREGELIDLTSFGGQQLQFPVIRSEADFNNVVGLYRVENRQGTIIDPITGQSLQPGQNGYIQAAVQLSLENGRGITLDRNGIRTGSTLQGGLLYAPFIIANGTPEEAVNQSVPVYFAFLGANGDRIDRVRVLGDNTFGFEDLPGGGDADYNDFIFQAQFLPV